MLVARELENGQILHVLPKVSSKGYVDILDERYERKREVGNAPRFLS